MSEIKTISQAKAVIEYQFGKKKQRIDSLERKIELNNREKIFIGEEVAFMEAVNQLLKLYEIEFKKNLGKIPPAAIDLEESVLGAILLEPKSIPVFLSADHFYVESHQQIFTTILQMKRDNIAIDMQTIIIALRKNGLIELIGGPSKIVQLTSCVASAANIEYHARVLIEFGIKRELIRMAGDLIYQAYDDKSDALVILNEYKNRIVEIETTHVR